MELDYKTAAQQDLGNSRGSDDEFRLQELFPPPSGLLFQGSYAKACKVATEIDRWLITTVDEMFQCQIVNREVWRSSGDTSVRDLIRERFVYWRACSDSEDGRQYMVLYGITGWPHIAIINPQTGEKMASWQKFDADSFYETVSDFLVQYPTPSLFKCDLWPTKRAKVEDALKVETSNLNLEKFQSEEMVLEDNEKPLDLSVVRYNEETCCAPLEEKSDSIDNVKLSLLESSAQFESGCLNVSQATLKMLQSKNGQDWLTIELLPLAAFCIRNNELHLTANSEMTLQSAVKHFHEIIASLRIPFQNFHEVFLQSFIWSQQVEAMEKSLLISIIKNESSQEIEVGGKKDDVEKGLSEIKDLLTKNGQKERVIKCRLGIVRLLEKNEKAIMNSIESHVNNAPVSISFQPQGHLIQVNGLQDDIDFAAHILDNYICDVLYDSIEANIPGVTKDLFDEHIDILERRHGCVIEVRIKTGLSNLIFMFQCI